MNTLQAAAATDHDAPLFHPSHLARATDPATSHEAAASIDLGALQRAALEAVRASEGRTATELAIANGHGDPRVFNRRLGELEKGGYVIRGKARRCSVTGRSAATWFLAGAGLRR